MVKLIITMLAVSLLLGCGGGGEEDPAPAPAETPPAQEVRAADFPDYKQADPAFGGFPSGGVAYCAPVAVSDWVQYMAATRPSLDMGAEDPKQSQYELIRELARYMETDPARGTPINRLTMGLQKFFRDYGYPGATVLYHGWRFAPTDLVADATVTPAEIQAALDSGFGVVLVLALAQYDEAADTYNIKFTHTVAAVESGPDGVLIHDPAKSSPLTLALVVLDSGRLGIGQGTSYYTRDAAGSLLGDETMMGLAVVIEGMLVFRP